jgi:heme ABC exporter ATP-binding subunit CcmA
VIRATEVSQVLGGRMALGPLDLQVRRGERLAVLGDNGAGKTSLLRLLATLAPPAGGRIDIDGLDTVRDRDRLRSRIGHLGHQPGLAPALTAHENLMFFARLHGVAGDKVAQALDEGGLSSCRTAVGRMSRGEQQRIGLLRATLHQPELLLLDEPDSSLDSSGRELLARMLKNRTVVLATHDHVLARQLCDRVLCLKQGQNCGDSFPAVANGERLSCAS